MEDIYSLLVLFIFKFVLIIVIIIIGVGAQSIMGKLGNMRGQQS